MKVYQAVIGLSLITLLSGSVVTNLVVKDIEVKTNFSNELRFGVNEVTPDAAIQRLSTAQQWLEANNLNEGSSCIWIESPQCNLTAFNAKLKNSITTLKNVENSDELTKSNTLIRIRESFMEQTSEDGEVLNIPNLSLVHTYGVNNLGLFSAITIISAVLFILCLAAWFIVIWSVITGETW